MRLGDKTKMDKSNKGFSLVEVLIAAVILAIVGIPVIGIFIGSKDAIVRTDAARDNRYFINEILAHAERQSLHDLWDLYGPNEVVAEAGRMKHELAIYDPRTGKVLGTRDQANPLGFEPSFFMEMNRAGIKAKLYFEFYSRKELKITPEVPNDREPDSASPYFGILHMQAGYATVRIIDLKLLAKTRNEEKATTALWQQPIMCPAVVGRPGLKLASCPAVDRKVRNIYLPRLARREAQL